MNSIVFFDGVCGLCNGFVNFLLRVDTHHVLRFAPLQGKTAAQLGLPQETIIFYHHQQTYQKSQAILQILKRLGGFWRVLSFIGSLIPLRLANILYDGFARHRYALFGRRATCRVPTSQEKFYFLDT